MVHLSHTCEALLLTCIDFRLHPELENLLKQEFRLKFDYCAAAGAVKNLVKPEKDEDREFVLRQIEKSKKLHEIQKVVLVNHTDCGAYGGKQAFAAEDEENNAHKQDLKLAGQIIQENFPSLQVELFLAHLHPLNEEWKVTIERVD